jgi:hypothetical protein
MSTISVAHPLSYEEWMAQGWTSYQQWWATVPGWRKALAFAMWMTLVISQRRVMRVLGVEMP